MAKQDQTNPNVQPYETGPCPDFLEVTVGAGILDVSAIGDYPVRGVKVVAGSGTLKVKTAKSGSTYRDATLAAGEDLGNPVQITEIGGTSAGTTGITKVRVFK